MSQWNSIGEFFAMGGYGFYVWGSYLVTFGFILAEIVMLRKRQQSVRKQIARLARINEKVDEA